ncbi:glucose-6-phosphatase 2 [Calliphora vicina]|uniref:glucose-6-phosphatase 2 n=1 Tax=Calliphora vicina TaxID=7373 RepID=UPI00325B0084
MDFSLTSLYEFEININKNVQKQFFNLEQTLRNINDYLDPIYILNFWIPLVGAFNHKLLIQLTASIGIINTLASVIKWCSPEYRPIWWLKENADNYKYNFKDIQIDPFSCDTSAGFPSTHAAAFTTFVFVLVWRLVKSILSSFDFMLYDKYLLIYAIASLLSAALWFSRLYFLFEFLHQCILGSLFAVGLIHIFNRFSTSLLSLRKLKAVLVVFGLASLPISAYFGMLYMDVDPFWSVRMAFKWCADPLYLKHESTPVFTLSRDFGYLLGVALSCPLFKSYDNTANTYRKRLPVLCCMEILNFAIRSYTPKQYGRFMFVAYEFLRNCLHSFMLLHLLPKFDVQ